MHWREEQPGGNKDFFQREEWGSQVKSLRLLQDYLPVTLLDGAGGAYFFFLLFLFGFQALDDLLEQWAQGGEYPPERGREGNA
jgi:hypothetical protein